MFSKALLIVLAMNWRLYFVLVCERHTVTLCLTVFWPSLTFLELGLPECNGGRLAIVNVTEYPCLKVVYWCRTPPPLGVVEQLESLIVSFVH